MDMGTMTSMSMMMPSATISEAVSATTDNTPGQTNSKGQYVPTMDEMMSYQAARISWDAQVKYGYYTLGFLCGILVIHTILNCLWKLRMRYSRRGQQFNKSSSTYSKIVALARTLTYPRLPQNHLKLLHWIWTLGPLGPNILLISGVLFATGFTFINEYYYYPPFYGSAPLYLRSEWIAMATLPFVYVLGSKRNIISILTSVSHEKLQVLHQGAAFIFTYMSLVHTIAACIRAMREIGMKATVASDSAYVSGFVALAPLLVLFVGALPPFRRPFYESFYWIHITMAVFFLGAMFWHGYQLLDSDAYMIATIVLFLTSVLSRVLMIIFNNPILHQAKAELVDSETLKLTIPTLYIKWTPGQHVFLRFLGVRVIDSHPFSISNIPSPQEKNNQVKEMVFLLKPFGVGGFTRELFKRVENGQDTFKVLIDGPYGGTSKDNELRRFDKVLICTGGTGITWSLSILQDLVYYGEKGQEVVLVWAIKRASSMSWFEKELSTIKTHYPHVKIQIYITGQLNEKITLTNSTSSSSDNEIPHELNQQSPSGSDHDHTLDDTPNTEKEMTLNSMTSSPQIQSRYNGHFEVHSGRPNLPNLIEGVVASTQGSLAIATCGPEGFQADCSNSITKAQIGILTGRYQELTEVYLKSESYGW